MPIISSQHIVNDVGTGWFDHYQTVTRGFIEICCGCGTNVVVKVRKQYKDNTPYEFEVFHRSRSRKFSAEDPTALQLFDRIWQVSSKHYVTCDWPM